MIYGTDYNTPYGTCLRDYIHVTHLITAHILSLEYLFNGSRPVIFNLGNSSRFSVMDVLDMARIIMRRKRIGEI